MQVQNHVSQLRKSREHKNKMVALGKNFLVFQVGSRGVLTVARLCLGLKIGKKTCCLMVAVPYFAPNA